MKVEKLGSGHVVSLSWRWRSKAGFGDYIQAHLLQQPVHVNEPGKALVLSLSMEKTVVNLLHDTGQTKQAVGVVEVEIVDTDARTFGVIVDERLARQHAGGIARLATCQLNRQRVVSLDPVGEGIAQVHQRITERGQFPVQHADDVHRVIRIEDHIVEAVVVMHDAGGGRVGGHFVCQPRLDLLPCRSVRGSRFFITLRPARNLPLHVTLGFAQITQAARLVINAVQVHQFVDEALAQVFSLSCIQRQFGRQIRAQDDPLDALHHVKLRADHRLIRAVQVRLRAIGEGIPELIENAVFTTHVMCRSRLVSERWAPQHQLALWVLNQVGQVRCASGELTDRRGAMQIRQMRLQVRIYQGGVQFFAATNPGGLVSQCHTYTLCLLWSAQTID
ncbi:Unknown protein sequence [Pseudomonas amygdali pv. mellea]|nr:Unknown protein sequence [Pseudomonas amygdali pv. mellea]